MQPEWETLIARTQALMATSEALVGRFRAVVAETQAACSASRRIRTYSRKHRRLRRTGGKREARSVRRQLPRPLTVGQAAALAEAMSPLGSGEVIGARAVYLSRKERR